MMYDRVTGRLFDRIDDGLDAHFIPGPDYNPFAYQYLTFVPLKDSTFSFSKRGTGNDIEYSIDGGAWTTLASGANTPTVGAGHNIRWRAELVPSTTSGNQGIGTFSASGLYDAMGNTMSLLYGDNFVGQTTLVGTYTFPQLWRGDTHIHMANRMVLPATILAAHCYRAMFYGCNKLIAPPDLLASILVSNCYRAMFYGCTNLRYIKMLATNISASNCLFSWVSGVASTGTFVKNAAMTTLPTGASGIPDGWTVVDDPSTINS